MSNSEEGISGNVRRVPTENSVRSWKGANVIMLDAGFVKTLCRISDHESDLDVVDSVATRWR
jgi:hypothetical protein